MAGFCISALECGGGTLALSPMPGRGGDYAGDLRAVLGWAPDLVLTMTPRVELAAVAFPDDLGVAGVGWAHFPVADFGVPDDGSPGLWAAIEQQALARLAEGGRVLVHCFGGCGRSGMAVLRLMAAAGEEPAAALARLRAVRPCAVETEAQLRWATGRG